MAVSVSDDFALIEAAVLETARGRWFLQEYAKRIRSADTEKVLASLARLEVVVQEKPSGDVERLRFDLKDMAKAIAKTKSEIASIKTDALHHDRLGDASLELDAIVSATETATSDILAAAEHIQETAWTLREHKAPETLCDIIDQRATDIYTACSFQDLTGQRTRKVIQVIHYLEDRINAMIQIWGVDVEDLDQAAAQPQDRLLNGPALPGQGLAQGDVDAMMVEMEAAQALLVPCSPVELSPEALSSSLALVSQMDDADKVAAFS